MKFIKSITLIVLFPLFLSSCHKFWLCAVPTYEYVCIKGLDTTYVSSSMSVFTSVPSYGYSQSYDTNIIKYYTQNGYSVSIAGEVRNEDVYDAVTVKAYQDNGIKCIEEKSF